MSGLYASHDAHMFIFERAEIHELFSAEKIMR